MSLDRQENLLTEEQVRLADSIFKQLERYRQILKDSGQGVNMVWIENEETGEFVAYTLGEVRNLMKDKLGEL